MTKSKNHSIVSELLDKSEIFLVARKKRLMSMSLKELLGTFKDEGRCIVDF